MNEKKKPVLGQEAVTDARTLGVPRMLILGLQHLFAMFGATVLVPILVQDYGLPLSIQTTLLMAGLEPCCSMYAPSSRYLPSLALPSPIWAAFPPWLPCPPMRGWILN